MIFCNSLTTTLDMKRLKKLTPLHIVSPLDVYEGIARKLKSIYVIAANGHTLSSIEAFMLARNATMKVTGFSSLEFVQLIEKENDPVKIFDQFPFANILENAHLLKAQAVILGCTHLSRILPQIEEHSLLPVIDTGTVMTQLVQASLHA